VYIPSNKPCAESHPPLTKIAPTTAGAEFEKFSPVLRRGQESWGWVRMVLGVFIAVDRGATEAGRSGRK